MPPCSHLPSPPSRALFATGHHAGHLSDDFAPDTRGHSVEAAVGVLLRFFFSLFLSLSRSLYLSVSLFTFHVMCACLESI